MNRVLAATGRSVRRLVFYILLPLTVLGLLTWAFLLPNLVERAAHAWLAANGRDDITFTVEHIDLYDATIRAVSVADGALTADLISVHYTPERLRRGKADRIVVSGLRWSTHLVDGTLDLGPFQNLVDGAPEGSTNTATGFAVPASDIRVRDAEISVTSDIGVVTLPITADIALAPLGDISGHASVHPRAPIGALSAALSFDRTAADGSLELFADISGGWFRAPAISALGVSGQIAFHLNAESGPNGAGYIEVARLNTPLGDIPGAANFAVASDTARLDLNLVTQDGAVSLGASADAYLLPRPTLDFSVDIAALSDTALERRSLSIVEIGRPPPKFSIAGQVATDDLKALLGATGLIDAMRMIDADGVIDLAVSDLSVPRLVDDLSARADLSFAVTRGAALIDSETLSLSAQRFDGQLFGVTPGDLAHAYLDGGGELTFAARDGPAVTAIMDDDGRIDMAIAGDLRLELGNVLAAHAGADRISVVADTVDGSVSWQTVERGEFVLDHWSGRPFGLSLTEARANVEGIGGQFTGTATVAARGDLTLPGGIVAKDSHVSLATDLEFSGDYLTVRLREPEIASFGAIDIPGETPLAVDAIALRSRNSAAKPLLDVRFAEGGDIRFDAGLDLAPIGATATAGHSDNRQATLAFDIAKVSLAADGEMRPGAAPTYRVKVVGEDGSADLSTGETLAPGLPMAAMADGVSLSVTAASDAPVTATLETRRVAHPAPRPLIAPLRVSLAARVAAGIVGFDARLREGSGNLVIDVKGQHDLARDQGNGTVEMFPLLFLENGLQPGRLIPYFAPRLGPTTGGLSLSGPVAWSDAGVTSNLLLTVEDFNTAFDEVTIAGVNTAITVDRLMPPSTPPGQLVAIAGVDLGLPLTDGLVSMRLDRNGKPLVERSQWQWAGGKVATSLSRADTKTETDLLVLEIDGIALDQLLELTPQGANIEATGSLFGRIPVVFRDGAFVIVDGWLESSFEGGEIRYTAEELTPGLLAGGEGVGLLLDALDNFHYSRLRVDLAGLPDGETEMRFRIRGANPDLYGGAEVELNMGITGQLEQILRQSYEAYYQVPEEVARRLAGAAKRQATDGE